MSINNQNFKDALSQFATGVSVICTSVNHKLYGLTINSFASVSLEPKLVSFCIDNNSSNLEHFRKSQYFGINILSNMQEDLAKKFADPKADKFKEENYSINKNNRPHFNNSLAFLSGKLFQDLPCGDHHIFVIEIENITFHKNKKPLLYYNRNFITNI